MLVVSSTIQRIIHVPDRDVTQYPEDEDGEVGLVHEGKHGQPEHETQRYRHVCSSRPVVDEGVPAQRNMFFNRYTFTQPTLLQV